MVSTAAAVLAGAALFSTRAFVTGPEIIAAGLLMVVVEEDLRERRIPNRITFFGLAAAILHATWTAGLGGLLSALAGAGVGLAVLAVPFAMRWMGAGDVKAVMALGAFFGVAALPGLLWWITIVGGTFALCTILSREGLCDLARRWAGSLMLTALRRRPHYFAPAAGSAAATGIPFGVAIALGVAAHQAGGSTWLF
jgi:prepilin peptidase CpaA